MKKSVLALSLLSCSLAFAAEQPAQINEVEVAASAWRPSSAMQESFDWIRLNSDEWLKGSLVAMYDKELEFDSEELGILALDWGDVAEVLTYEEQSLRLLDKRVVRGKLHVKDGVLSLQGSEGVEEIDRNQVVSIAATADASELDYWSGKASVGFNFRDGNTEQTDLIIDASAQRRTAQSRWINAYLANYTEQSDIKTVDNQRFNSTYDWFLTQRLFWRAATFEYYSDEFQNIDSRMTVTTELGYTIFDEPSYTWEVSGGPGYQVAKFDSVAAGEDDKEKMVIAKFGTDFSWDITSDVEYVFHYDLQVLKSDAGSFIHHLKTGVAVDLYGDLDLEVMYYLDRVNEPVADSAGVEPEQDDSRLSIGLGYEF